MPPETVEVRRWVEKADHDRRMAELGLAQSPPLTEAAAFHAQQAVEKLLKAYLVCQRHEFERIQDLGMLAEQCAQHDPAFDTLREQVDPLTPYAVRFRYPGPIDPTVEEVQTAMTVVREVWAFVTDRLPPEARP